jgi:hypothetical protein
LESPASILARSKVSVLSETFTIISLSAAHFARLMQNPDLSPRMTAPFMILKDELEVTMLLDDADFDTMRHALHDAKVARSYRLVTFDVELHFGVVGFMAEISRILADAAIPILPIEAFTRDHILIRQQDLSKALKALSPHVLELC